MIKLVIHAPAQPKCKTTPSITHNFENYFKTGIGIGYAISDTEHKKILEANDCIVVLLRKDNTKRRAEGHLTKLVPTGKYIHRRRRYNVHFADQRMVPYKPEKLNHYGIAVICPNN
jgi:hypothetical protein